MLGYMCFLVVFNQILILRILMVSNEIEKYRNIDASNKMSVRPMSFIALHTFTIYGKNI